MATKVKLNNLSEKELLEKLKSQLVATVGTCGSRKGCSLSTAFKDYV